MKEGNIFKVASMCVLLSSCNMMRSYVTCIGSKNCIGICVEQITSIKTHDTRTHSKITFCSMKISLSRATLFPYTHSLDVAPSRKAKILRGVTRTICLQKTDIPISNVSVL
jgi:hypothetical protein